MESEFGKLFLSNYRALDRILPENCIIFSTKFSTTLHLGDVEKMCETQEMGVFIYICILPLSGAGFCPKMIQKMMPWLWDVKIILLMEEIPHHLLYMEAYPIFLTYQLVQDSFHQQ